LKRVSSALNKGCIEMATPLSRRLARLEAAVWPAPVVPHVVEVATGEDEDGAFARFCEQWAGRLYQQYPVIVCPARANDEELSELEIQWAEQQRRLIADAKAERREEDNAGTEHRAQQHGKRRIVNSGDRTGQPNEGVVGRPFAVRTRH
jgi:hypothetical protein